MNYENIPGAFLLIIDSALSGQAAVGGFAGSTVAYAVRFGIARGVFSNEAGLGSAPIAHATAKTTHSVRQGLIAMLGPFIHTIVVCSLTGLVIVLFCVPCGYRYRYLCSGLSKVGYISRRLLAFLGYY